ncbi:MAG TPA: DUF177 domain-containing protein [Acidimicrobiia bacterium]|jgi:uncharacterized protein|nr:DUF177 domain-containing protein [Acidimicrobiia bacterium]
MPTTSAFRIPVANLMRRPGASRAVEVEGTLADVRGPGAEVAPTRPIRLDLTLERVAEGLVVRGTVEASWEAACSRCLNPVGGELAVRAAELYERQPLEGETYLLAEDDVIDLEPLIRDALLLELPTVPLCRTDCLGLCPSCGIDHNLESCECDNREPDPRWAALRSLDI